MAERKSIDALKPRTRLVRAGLNRSPHGETAEAIFMTSGFCYDTAESAERRFKNEEPGFVYSRFSNPTVAMLEARIAAYEGAEAARCVASGMAAINGALMAQVAAGDEIVAAEALFSSSRYILEDLLGRFGVKTIFVDGRDLDQWRRAIGPKTRTVLIESPANPTLDLVDIRGVADLAHAVGATVIVDNVFATPMLQRPLDLGADIVVYSATKHIDGQGRCLGGIVLSNRKFVDEVLTPFLRHTGPSISPFNAWLLVKGLETLELRVAESCRSAARIADFLADHPGVAHLAYPGRPDHPQADLVRRQMSGGGPLIAFALKTPAGEADKARAFRFLNALKIIDISNNLGDAKSLIAHPETTTHQRLTPEARARLGITGATLRLSVGLEDVEDLIHDLDQAIAANG